MKMLAKIMSLILMLSITLITVVSASDNSTEVSSVPTSMSISAKSGILMDKLTGKILFEKNSHEKLAPASITKVMTMLLVMEQIDSGTISLQDMVTTSTHANSMGGSQIWLKEGEQMSVHDLLKATAVASANDAAMALAEHVGGSPEGFIKLMNDKAAELSMNDTVFLNPTGLDEKGHYSSAHDIAVMTRELLKYDKIKEYTTIWMDSLRDGKTELVNTNKLVRFYKGATGMKTGTTNDAGSCISATATRDDMELIAVVLGSSNSKDRFDDAKRMLDYGFANFAIYKPTTTVDMLPQVSVTKGVDPIATLTLTTDEKIIVPSDKAKLITEEITLNEVVDAPLVAGQKLGELNIMIEDNVIATYDILVKDDLEKITFGNGFAKLIRNLIEM